MGLWSTVSFPSGVWGAATAEIEFGAVGLKMVTNIVKLFCLGEEVIFCIKNPAP